ncbi:MAG: hypothetical protein IIA83_07395 [Thaumarchaeota archaeon]|nr:hypothetical protein [Nitrososphaerota archaeon]
MTIFARFLDMDTFEPVKVHNVYLQIISTNDHVYWKTTLMKQNVSTLQIAVPTLEMEDNQYIVKVSDHKEMLSFGFHKVKVRKKRFFQSKKQHLQVA